MAKELGKDPERILEWPFRAFLFWTGVAADQRNDEYLLKGMVTAASVWDQKKLVELLDIKDESSTKKKEEIIRDAVQKAKKFKFRPASIEEITKRN
jgi:hypothetical protein